MFYRKIIADNIKQFRKINNISQEELAFRCGISTETLSLIERNLSNTTLEILENICAYIDITIPELFTENSVNDKYLRIHN